MTTLFAHNKSKAIDTLITALAPIIWGTTYIVTSELLPPDRPFIAAFLRTLPAGIFLLLWCRQLPKRATWWRLILLSALNLGAFQALLFIAAYRLPGGLAAVISAASPLLVMGLAWVWDHVRPQTAAIVAAMVGVLGMASMLLSPRAQWDSIGVLAALLSTLCMGSGTFLTRRWQLGLPALALTGWQLFLGGLMLSPLAYWIDPPLAHVSVSNMAGYAYLSIAGALFSYSVWFRGVTRLPSVSVASLGLLSPVTAVILGWLVLEQSLRGSALLGCLLVLVSILAICRLNASPSSTSTSASTTQHHERKTP